jgi:hypothetical protein
LIRAKQQLAGRAVSLSEKSPIDRETAEWSPSSPLG